LRSFVPPSWLGRRRLAFCPPAVQSIPKATVRPGRIGHDSRNMNLGPRFANLRPRFRLFLALSEGEKLSGAGARPAAQLAPARAAAACPGLSRLPALLRGLMKLLAAQAEFPLGHVHAEDLDLDLVADLDDLLGGLDLVVGQLAD